MTKLYVFSTREEAVEAHKNDINNIKKKQERIALKRDEERIERLKKEREQIMSQPVSDERRELLRLNTKKQKEAFFLNEHNAHFTITTKLAEIRQTIKGDWVYEVLPGSEEGHDTIEYAEDLFPQEEITEVHPNIKELYNIE